MPDNITPEGLADDAQLTSAAPVGTVSPDASATAPAAVLSLEEINKHLGKTFPTKEAALKAFADTFSYVGKKKEDIENEVRSQINRSDSDNRLANELTAIRKDMFYKDNPQYAPYKAMIDKLGGNPSEVVLMPEFKDVFTKASGFDETQKLKTVLESNPRLASSKDNLTKAAELRSKGASSQSVEALVAQSVREAFDL